MAQARSSTMASLRKRASTPMRGVRSAIRWITIGDPSDGIDAQSNTGVQITNESTGVVEGARHGITGGNTDTTTDGSFTMNVSNAGVIQGDDGSGINID